MTDRPVYSFTADRARRYRQRRREGKFLIRVEVDKEVAAGLARYGLVDEIAYRNEIASAIELVLDAISKHKISFDLEWVASLPCVREIATRILRRMDKV